LVAGFLHQLDHYKRLVFRYWWIPLLIAGLSAGVEWFYLKRAAPVYMSVGKMIVNVKVSVPDGNVYSEEDNNFFGTQVALMESDSVLQRVNAHMRSEHPERPPEPVTLGVTIVPKSSIFYLRATGESATYTQEYLQATMDEYIKLKRNMLENASTSTRATMVEEIKEIAKELQQSKEAVYNFQSSNKVVFLQPTGENSAADYLATLTRQLAEKKADLQLLTELTLDQNLERQQGIFAQQGLGITAAGASPVQKDKPTPSPGAASQQNSASATPPKPVAAVTNAGASQNYLPTSLGTYEDAYLQAKQQLILLQDKREEDVKLGLKPDGLAMVNLDENIAHQDKLLQIYREQAQAQLINRQHTLEAEIHNLEDLVKEAELNALDASKKLATFDELKENQKRAQTRYDQMQANLQRLEVDKGIGQESVTLLEPAAPAEPVPPQRLKHLILAVLTGLLLGVGILLFVDRLDDRAWTYTDLEQQFDLPVLGQFPWMKIKDRKNGLPVLQLDDDRYPVIESYRSLRSALIYRNRVNEQPKSIMITSARPDDGKSTVSSNFAVTLARAGAHVLLIDADLRRGVLHKYFSVGATPGLAEVLGGRCDWSTAVVPTVVPNLDVLPCGKYSPDPGSLFATAGKFLADIPRHYDYYLFDTVPVMVGDDVLSLAPHVDALIMVIRAGFTSGRMARAALDSLYARQVKVIGLVFNGVRPGTSNYYNYKFKAYHPRMERK